MCLFDYCKIPLGAFDENALEDTSISLVDAYRGRLFWLKRRLKRITSFSLSLAQFFIYFWIFFKYSNSYFFNSWSWPLSSCSRRIFSSLSFWAFIAFSVVSLNLFLSSSSWLLTYSLELLLKYSFDLLLKLPKFL